MNYTFHTLTRFGATRANKHQVPIQDVLPTLSGILSSPFTLPHLFLLFKSTNLSVWAFHLLTVIFSTIVIIANI